MKSTRDTLSTFGTQLITLPLSMLAGIVITRALGPEDKGTYAYLLLCITMIVTVGSFGFEQGIFYYIAVHEYRLEEVILSALIIAISMSIVYSLAFIGIYCVGLLPDEVEDPVYVFSITASILPALGQFFLVKFLLANAQFTARNVLLLLPVLLQISLAIMVILINGGLDLVAISIPISYVLIAIVTLWYVIRNRTVQWRLDWQFIKHSMRYGLKSWIGAVALKANFRLDQLILGSTTPMAELGYYSISVRLTELLWYVGDSIGVVLLPKIANSKDNKYSTDLTARLFRLTFVLTLLGAGVLGVVAKPLLLFMYGSAFAAAAPGIYMLLPGTVTYIGAKIFSKYLTGTGKPGQVSIAQTAGSLASLGFYMLLIPPFGIIGAGIAASFGYTVASIAMWYFYRLATSVKLRALFIVTRGDLQFVYKHISTLFVAVYRGLHAPFRA